MRHFPSRFFFFSSSSVYVLFGFGFSVGYLQNVRLVLLWWGEFDYCGDPSLSLSLTNPPVSITIRYHDRHNTSRWCAGSGRKRKMGFGRKDKNAFSVHRSEEVMPNTLRHLVRQSSSMSSNEALEKSRDGDDDLPVSATGAGRGR